MDNTDSLKVRMMHTNNYKEETELLLNTVYENCYGSMKTGRYFSSCFLSSEMLFLCSTLSTFVPAERCAKELPASPGKSKSKGTLPSPGKGEHVTPAPAGGNEGSGSSLHN